MLERTMSMNDESIDELFATTFDGIRNTVTDAINKIIDFIGEWLISKFFASGNELSSFLSKEG